MERQNKRKEERRGRLLPEKAMKCPKELKYVKSHEWVREEGDTVKIGITDFAQESLGDLVFINLPEVESVKAVSDVYSPVSGVVVKVNGELADHPELVNQDPYGTWMIEVSEVQEHEEFMDSETYEAYLETDEAKA